MTVEVLRYAASTADGAGGDPVGVVLGAGALTDGQMLAVAQAIGCSGTAFVVPVAEAVTGSAGPRSQAGTSGAGGAATATVRFFSPVAEVASCGHATVAAATTPTSSSASATAARSPTWSPTTRRWRPSRPGSAGPPLTCSGPRTPPRSTSGPRARPGEGARTPSPGPPLPSAATCATWAWSPSRPAPPSSGAAARGPRAGSWSTWAAAPGRCG